MKFKPILALSALALPLSSAAQSQPTVFQNIDFETVNWARLGVYDSWVASPFRDGRLEGNVAVVDNPFKAQLNPLTGEAINPSNKVLAIQRSRFGSNVFGARIDLQTPFALRRDNKYAHVLINSPQAGRVMVLGLGKRDDRAGQSKEVEQFWSVSTGGNVGEWKEVVVPLNGNDGISIYSLVIVPHLESPHTLSSDFVAYIDNIIVDDNRQPYVKSDFYPTAYDRSQTATRSDRRLLSVTLRSADGTQNYQTQGNLLYQHPAQSFWAKAGETLQASIGYQGSYMHGYLYLDATQRGYFTADDAVSYSYLSGKNSKGSSANENSVSGSSIALPSFTLPTTLAQGIYRLRYKVDWDNNDPLGATAAGNNLLQNGGGYVDVLLNVHGDEATISDNQLNGEVLAYDGTKLNQFKAPFGKAFKIRMNPENGFEYSGIRVKHGYHLDGDSIVRGNQQWRTEVFDRAYFDESDHSFSIPARCIDGEVLIQGFMVEKGKYTPPPSRFATTMLKDGQLQEPITWHTLQIGAQGYVLTANGSSAMTLTSTAPEADNPRQQWAFVGNELVGYQLYNRATGTTKVLTAPNTMSGTAGGSSYATMRATNLTTTAYNNVWRFESTNVLGEDQPAFFMYPDGQPSHKVNNRDQKFSFWTGGADGGSAIRVSTAYVQPVGIRSVTTSFDKAATYGLDGRRAQQSQHGIFVQGGKKVIR